MRKRTTRGMVALKRRDGDAAVARLNQPLRCALDPVPASVLDSLEHHVRAYVASGGDMIHLARANFILTFYLTAVRLACGPLLEYDTLLGSDAPPLEADPAVLDRWLSRFEERLLRAAERFGLPHPTPEFIVASVKQISTWDNAGLGLYELVETGSRELRASKLPGGTLGSICSCLCNSMLVSLLNWRFQNHHAVVQKICASDEESCMVRSYRRTANMPNMRSHHLDPRPPDDAGFLRQFPECSTELVHLVTDVEECLHSFLLLPVELCIMTNAMKTPTARGGSSGSEQTRRVIVASILRHFSEELYAICNKALLATRARPWKYYLRHHGRR